MEYLGSCLCKGIKFKVSGDFERFYLCHCRYCRKDTGSAHAANLFSTTAELIWIKTETEIGVFLQRYGKRFSLKNGKRYGFRLRCRGFLSPNRGNGRSRNGRARYDSVRYGQGDKFGRTTVE